MDFSERLQQRILRSHVKKTEIGMLPADYLAASYKRFDKKGWLQAITAGKVLVNGTPAEPDIPLKEHDCVAFLPEETPEPEADLTFSTVYADNDIAVLEKSGNLCTHPTGPFFRHTLWHLAGRTLGELRFITRLDQETSGLILACRNKKAAAAAENALNSIRKEYYILVKGIFPEYLKAEGFLLKDTASLAAKKKKFLPSAATADGEYACTELFAAEYRPGNCTLVRAVLHTGRQHQIRATLYSLGFPVVGDKLYGTDETVFLKIKEQKITPKDLQHLGMARQALHAAKLIFPHPATGEIMTFTSPCPF